MADRVRDKGAGKVQSTQEQWSITASPTMKRIGKSGRIHGKAGGWCRTAIRRLSAGNCLMKFPHYGKPSKQSRKNEKISVQTAQKEQSEHLQRQNLLQKVRRKIWFVIGKVMVRCIFNCASCHVSISKKDLWNGINKELHQRMEEHRDLQKLVRKRLWKNANSN